MDLTRFPTLESLFYICDNQLSTEPLELLGTFIYSVYHDIGFVLCTRRVLLRIADYVFCVFVYYLFLHYWFVTTSDSHAKADLDTLQILDNVNFGVHI